MDEKRAIEIKDAGEVSGQAETADSAFRARVASDPKAIALTDSSDRDVRGFGPPRAITYGQADAIADRIATALRDIGLNPGDVIALQAPNIVEVPLTILGVWRAGLVPCLMPVLWQLDEIDQAFSKAQPKAAISIARYGAEETALTLAEVASNHLSIRFLFAFGDNPPDGVTPIDDWFQLPDDDSGTPPPPMDGEPGDADSLAVLTWTVTRTGNEPVPRTHRQLVTLARLFATTFGLRKRDVILNPYPYSSIATLAGQLVAPLATGAETVLHLPFDFETFVTQLEQHAITCAIAPAPVIAALEERRDLHSQKFKLRQLGCVWPSPHAVKTGRDLFEPSLPIIDIHNFSELAVLPRARGSGADASLLPLGKIHIDENNPDSEVVLETRVRGSVTNRDNEQILKGSLVVRGPTVPSGPYTLGADADDTRSGSPKPDTHGFLDTGIGCIAGNDIAGHFRCQKSEDVIYHGGAVLTACELDRLYAAFPEFLDAAAFAIEDSVIGERVFAAVVPQPDVSPSLDRLRDYLAHKRVAPYKIPDQLVIVRSIPRSKDGEVLRDQILTQI